MPHHSHGNFSLSNPGEVTHSAAARARSFVSLDFIHNYSYIFLVAFHSTVFYWSWCRTIGSGQHHVSPPLKFQTDISHPDRTTRAVAAIKGLQDVSCHHTARGRAFYKIVHPSCTQKAMQSKVIPQHMKTPAAYSLICINLQIFSPASYTRFE